jgi:hypothetical protein
VRALVELAGLDEHRQLHAAPAAGGETIAQHIEAGGDQSEQVAGLGKRIFPALPSGDRLPSSPLPTGLPFASSTGRLALSACRVTV